MVRPISRRDALARQHEELILVPADPRLEENKAVFRRFHTEVIGRGNLDVIDEVVHPDAVSHDPLPGQAPGAAGLKDAMAMFRRAFPDLTATAEDTIAEGDRVVTRFSVTATHEGAFMGLAATGQHVSYQEVVIVRITDGMIVEHWAVADVLTMMQQLGAVVAAG
jgi:steroid delta-isomerase-like uncharacterized protein